MSSRSQLAELSALPTMDSGSGDWYISYYCSVTELVHFTLDIGAPKRMNLHHIKNDENGGMMSTLYLDSSGQNMKLLNPFPPAYLKQQSTFKSQIKLPDMKALTLASLKITHTVLQKKKPFTELENVALPCLEVAADLIHGGKDVVKKVKRIPLSDTTISRRSVMLADDLKKQLVKKLRLAASFGIQLDETTDIGGEAQLIVYCRFPDLEEKTFVEHYLEALVAKRLNETRNTKEKNDFELLLDDVVKMVNHICAHEKKSIECFRECGWEHSMQATEQTLEVHMAHLVIRHLTLMQENLDFYFPDSENDQLTSNMWMFNPFTDEATDYVILFRSFEQIIHKKQFSRHLAIPWISGLPCLVFQHLASSEASS
ncbi:protein FAM200C-like [Procambarus clarkii]|uniref:protein FAM200C-like n=1 Tax=Procambarus clarkii TaxID=6728 RepID=UPI0037435811